MTAVREHRLLLDGRSVVLLEGPAGWGECSPMPGYPCDPAVAWRAAWEAATVGWPAPVRADVPVNARIIALAEEWRAHAAPADGPTAGSDAGERPRRPSGSNANA